MLRGLALAVVTLCAIACAGPVPPTPNVPVPPTPSPAALASSSPTPNPTPTSTAHALGPTPSPGSLAPGLLAEVQRHVKQVADPENPKDTSFQSPGQTGARVLTPLDVGYDVYLLESRVVNGHEWWRIADSAYVGCCAPFGWIPAAGSDGSATLAPSLAHCPQASGHLTSYDFIHPEGSFDGPACFGHDDFTIRGYLACDRPSIDGALFLSGLNSYDQTGYECKLDDRMTIFGDIVPNANDPQQNGWHEVVDLTGHYYDPASVGCRWVPGSMYPIDTDNAPVDTAQFACQMELYATSVTPLP